MRAVDFDFAVGVHRRGDLAPIGARVFVEHAGRPELAHLHFDRLAREIPQRVRQRYVVAHVLGHAAVGRGAGAHGADLVRFDDLEHGLSLVRDRCPEDGCAVVRGGAVDLPAEVVERYIGVTRLDADLLRGHRVELALGRRIFDPGAADTVRCC